MRGGNHILKAMTVIVLVILASASAHLLWLRRKRKILMPSIGSRWVYTTYISRQRVEVVDHHPWSNEITFIRTHPGDVIGAKCSERLNARVFMNHAQPCGRMSKQEHPARNGAKS